MIFVRYFNYLELLHYSNHDPEAIIVLTHALVIGYNNLLTVNRDRLCQQLHIDNVPTVTTKFFERVPKARYGKFITTYRTKEPLSYFTNPRFLYQPFPALSKAIYIKFLGMRAIGDTRTYIPSAYIDNPEKHRNNPFLLVDKDKIHFLPEEIRR